MDRGQIQAKVHLAGGAQPAGRNEEWPTMTLGAVADIKTGATPSTQVPKYWNGTIPWCIPTDITGTPGKYLLTTERTITEDGLNSCGASLLPTGSLLLCSRATVGDVKIAASTVCTNQGFKSLICKDGTSNEFLYYLLLTLKSRIIQRATGSTFLEIAKRDVASIEVLVPPLPEQRAIAEALSDVDGLLGALEVLIAKKWDIKRATMQQLLTGKTRLPGFTEQWKRVQVGDVAAAQQGGTPPKSRTEYWDGDIPFVTGADLSEFSVSRDNARSFLTVEGLNSGATVICEPGALLLATRTRVGLVSMASETMGASQDITLLKPKDLVEPPYLCRALMSQTDLLLRSARGTTIQGISRGEVNSIPILLPPRPEQHAIATALSDMDAEIAALEERRDKIDAIKQGMMQVLLTGRVRLVKPDVVAEASAC